jgi:hypothetical protein
MAPLWEDDYPPGDFEGMSWAKGLTGSSAAALREPERILLAKVVKAQGGIMFHGVPIANVIEISGEDAVRLGAEIEDSTRDVPLTTQEWQERYAMRVWRRLDDGTQVAYDFHIAARTMVVMRPSQKRLVRIVEKLMPTLAKLTE